MFVTMKLTKRLAVVGVILGVCISILGFAGAKVGMSIAASAQAEKGISLPIIMYHNILKDPAMQGDYVISPELFEQDLQYLQANGYTGISMQDLLDYVNQGTPLPEKPVLLTFDDGYYNNYFYAYPLAKQYDFKMIISPVGMLTEKFSNTEDISPYYSHITWENIKEMLESGIVEFQNHTYNLHTNDGARKGAKKKEWGECGAVSANASGGCGENAGCDAGTYRNCSDYLCISVWSGEQGSYAGAKRVGISGNLDL